MLIRFVFTIIQDSLIWRGCGGRDRMVVGFTTTFASSVYRY